MLSSFACAIPGIMATRTIETPKDRLVTILVAPLMSCSARLPVYTLLIGACIGGVWMKSLTMLCMYLLGIVVALGMAWLFKKTLLQRRNPHARDGTAALSPPRAQGCCFATHGTGRNCFCAGPAR